MTLKFNSDTFKILQISDTQDGVKISPDTIELITKALDKVKPDLVVFTGDQIWGKSKFKGKRELVEKSIKTIIEPVSSRNIPFTFCFGNHDRQVGLSNEEQFEIYKSINGCIAESDNETDGVGNHCIEVEDSNGNIQFLIYMIDSHSSLSVGYDCVHKNQIDWYKKTRDAYIEKYKMPIPSIVFQHIPICEVFELMNQCKKSKKGAVRGFRTHANKWYVLDKTKVNPNGFMKESPADPQENSGEFEAFKEKGDVVGVYFGHDHNNSFNGKVDGVDIGYTQGAGFHVYGPGLDRGVRAFELKKDDIKNYKTYDLRYRDIVGKKVKEKLNFAILQIAPTNVYDAIARATKFFLCLGIVAIIVILLLFFFG